MSKEAAGTNIVMFEQNSVELLRKADVNETDHSKLTKEAKTARNDLRQYAYNHEKDLKQKILRVSNALASELATMDCKSWLLLEQIVKRIRPYDLPDPSDKAFQQGLADNTLFLTEKQRTIELTAEDYGKAIECSKANAERELTVDSIRLFREEFEGKFLSQDEKTAFLAVSKPLEIIGFEVGVRNTQEFKSLSIKNMIKDPTKDKITSRDLVHKARKVIIRLDNNFAKRLFYLFGSFTRFEAKGTVLSAQANKLYLLMNLDLNSRMKQSGQFNWDLETWNGKLGINNRNMSTLIRTFNLHEQISKHTNIFVDAYPDPDSKKGRSYQRFIVDFKRKSNPLSSEVDGLPFVEPNTTKRTKSSPEREREPLPRAKGAQRIKGSAESAEHARVCIDILVDYKKQLKKQGRKLPSRDVRLLKKYLAVIGVKDEATGLNLYFPQSQNCDLTKG